MNCQKQRGDAKCFKFLMLKQNMELYSQNVSDISKPSIFIKEFPDGENYIRISDPRLIREKEVLIIHRCYPNPDRSLIQLFLILDTVKRYTEDVRVVVPYLPYARQDKIFNEGEALSSAVISKLISSFSIKELITFDCHFLKKEGTSIHEGLRIRNVSLAKPIIEHVKNKLKKEFETISPDEGAMYMTEGKGMKKQRGEYKEEGGKVEREIKELEVREDVRGKNFLILDDIIASGGTMKKAAEALKKKGAQELFFGATHGLFLSNSLEGLRKLGTYIVTTNTVLSDVSKINFMDYIKESK